MDKAAILAGEFDKTASSDPNHWKLCSVTRVEEVKMMARLLPIWATTIIFWTTYAQMITFSVEQASTMERSIGNFQIPAGSLTVFFVAAILITLAVYDRFIMPMWKKWRGKPGKLERKIILCVTQGDQSITLNEYVFSLFSHSFQSDISNVDEIEQDLGLT